MPEDALDRVVKGEDWAAEAFAPTAAETGPFAGSPSQNTTDKAKKSVSFSADKKRHKSIETATMEKKLVSEAEAEIDREVRTNLTVQICPAE